MSGGRDHFSNKLIRELRTVFALISKSLQTDRIDTSLTVQSVIYPTALPAENFDVSCEWDTPVSVSNGMESEKPYQTDALPLISPDASLVYQSCKWSPVLVSEPVFEASIATLCRVRFDNVNRPYSSDIPIPKVELRDTIFSIPIPTSKTVAYNASLKPMQKVKEVHTVNVSQFRQRTHTFPKKLWQLPIFKSPLPPHRFTIEQKAKFRKALADKAFGENSDMPQSNIQLQMVYDRINLALFSSISQDDRGQLICYPKPEILENPAAFSRHYPSTYLVVGTRLDTRESIKALVPMES